MVVTVKKKKKAKIILKKGIIYINSTYNNILISIGDSAGNILAWSSSGKVGFKGPKKATPYAAGIVAKDLFGFIKESGLLQVDIIIKGVGMGREAAVRALAASGVAVQAIKDVTPAPHNGPRPKKPRRV